jgi:hypothetical protein
MLEKAKARHLSFDQPNLTQEDYLYRPGFLAFETGAVKTVSPTQAAFTRDDDGTVRTVNLSKQELASHPAAGTNLGRKWEVSTYISDNEKADIVGNGLSGTISEVAQEIEKPKEYKKAPHYLKKQLVQKLEKFSQLPGDTTVHFYFNKDASKLICRMTYISKTTHRPVSVLGYGNSEYLDEALEVAMRKLENKAKPEILKDIATHDPAKLVAIIPQVTSEVSAAGIHLRTGLNTMVSALGSRMVNDTVRIKGTPTPPAYIKAWSSRNDRMESSSSSGK